MKVVMYGTKACPDCVEAEEILKEKGIQYLINFRYEKSVPGDSTLLQNVSMSISM